MKNKLLIVPGYLAGIGSLFILTYQTLLAFLSNSKSVTIHINRFGEQYVDVFFLIIIWIICSIGLLLLYRFIKGENRKKSLLLKVNGKRVLDKNGNYVGILHNPIVDKKTGMINKIFIKPSAHFDSSKLQLNDKGNIVISNDNFIFEK